jgi:protein TonB
VHGAGGAPQAQGARRAEVHDAGASGGDRGRRARVVSGLGYGLDESALAAAKATIFEPATQCGKPVVGTTILPFRFEQI